MKEILTNSRIYQINLPVNLEESDVINNMIDFSNFKSRSNIFYWYSFDSEKYDKINLSEYVEIFNIKKEVLNFYSEYKDKKIGYLSIKKKIILQFLTCIKNYDCFVFSLEALSVNTIEFLLFNFSKNLIDLFPNKTIVFFNKSSTSFDFKKFEVLDITNYN